MKVEELQQVMGSQVLKGSVGNDEESEVDMLGDGEPVEVMKARGDTVTGGEKTGSRILHIL